MLYMRLHRNLHDRGTQSKIFSHFQRQEESHDADIHCERHEHHHCHPGIPHTLHFPTWHTTVFRHLQIAQVHAHSRMIKKKKGTMSSSQKSTCQWKNYQILLSDPYILTTMIKRNKLSSVPLKTNTQKPIKYPWAQIWPILPYAAHNMDLKGHSNTQFDSSEEEYNSCIPFSFYIYHPKVEKGGLSVLRLS